MSKSDHYECQCFPRYAGTDCENDLGRIWSPFFVYSTNFSPSLTKIPDVCDVETISVSIEERSQQKLPYTVCPVSEKSIRGTKRELNVFVLHWNEAYLANRWMVEFIFIPKIVDFRIADEIPKRNCFVHFFLRLKIREIWAIAFGPMRRRDNGCRAISLAGAKTAISRLFLGLGKNFLDLIGPKFQGGFDFAVKVGNLNGGCL